MSRAAEFVFGFFLIYLLKKNLNKIFILVYCIPTPTRQLALQSWLMKLAGPNHS